jgi:hypothetical protein
LKGENKMVGILREGVKVSPSRTYVALIYDLVAEDRVRPEVFILPEAFKNHTHQATAYFYATNADRATRLFDCIPYEEFMSGTASTLTIPKVYADKPIATSAISIKDDFTQVHQMLDAWNDEQKQPSTTYTMILRTILHKLAFQEKFIANLKQELLNL